MTRVLVPATPAGLHPATVPALLAGGHVVEVRPMVHDWDYCKALRYWWDKARPHAEDLVIVEHDVEARPEVLAQLLGCPLPWCVAPYNGHEALGCVRFRPFELGPWPLEEPVPWIQLDMALYRALRAAGASQHVHAIAPIHHHGEG